MQLSTFKFSNNHSIRAFEKDGLSWFIASDICKVLEIKNPTQAIEKLDDDERSMLNIGRSEIHGGGGKVNIINESGLYILILRSRNAMKQGTVQHQFRKWVTSEVLPTIRKTGKYESSLKVLPNNNTVEARRGLVAAVKQLAKAKSVDYSDAYRMVHQRFNVESIEQLSYEQIAQATEYVHHLILDKSLSGEVLGKEPNLSHGSIILSSDDVSELTYMLKHFPYLDAYYHRTASSVRNLNSHMTYVVHDRFSHCCLHAKHLASSLGLSIQSWNDVIGELG